eukprot:SAG31_NODE_13452_length_868_cov_1.271782_2_plen_105_part_00
MLLVSLFCNILGTAAQDLLGMTSGIKDYDGLMYMDWTLLFGHEDGLLPCGATPSARRTDENLCVAARCTALSRTTQIWDTKMPMIYNTSGAPVLQHIRDNANAN